MQDMSVKLLGIPCQGKGSGFPSESGRGDSCQDRQEGHRSGVQTPRNGPEGIVGGSLHHVHVGAPAPGGGAKFRDREDKNFN